FVSGPAPVIDAITAARLPPLPMPSPHFQKLPGPFRFHRGGEIPEVVLAYETWGELSPARDNVLFLTTGLSPGSHARSSVEDPTPGWWEEMIGPGRPIDTERFFVICNNSIGSCHGSTGPSSIDPRTGEPYRMSFPALSLEDIAASSRELLRSLGITRVNTVMGCSLGGMTALAYAVLFPDEVDQVVSISAATSASPFAIAFRTLQREAIRTDPNWMEGTYPVDHPPRRGMALARKLGVISYRSAQEWAQRFDRKRVPNPQPPAIEFEIEAYLQGHADRFVTRFDANSYLYLSKAMDLFDLAEYGAGSVEEASRKILAKRALVIGVESDILFPVSQQEELARALGAGGRDVTFHRFPSIQGHDSFLIDLARFGPAVAAFFEGQST
ncbi:MAG: homoserine O-acetyltransferase, partial [Thermoanaerobaculia bacterium]